MIYRWAIVFKARVKLAVLKELSKRSLSGYELITYLAGFSSRPSPGYMYPLLHDLEKKGFVLVKTSGRKKVYSITSKGTHFLASLEEKHGAFMASMIKQFAPISDKRELQRFYSVVKKMQSHKINIFRDMDALGEFKEAVFALYSSKVYEKKRNKMRLIISHASRELRELMKDD